MVVDAPPVLMALLAFQMPPMPRGSLGSSRTVLAESGHEGFGERFKFRGDLGLSLDVLHDSPGVHFVGDGQFGEGSLQDGDILFGGARGGKKERSCRTHLTGTASPLVAP